MGRRKGLKIPRPKGHTGSNPVSGTKLNPDFAVATVLWFPSIHFNHANPRLLNGEGHSLPAPRAKPDGASPHPWHVLRLQLDETEADGLRRSAAVLSATIRDVEGD